MTGDLKMVKCLVEHGAQISENMLEMSKEKEICDYLKANYRK